MMIQANILEQPFYVGLKVTLKDNSILAIYTSKKPTRTQTDLHLNDYQTAVEIKELIDKIIKKYKTTA